MALFRAVETARPEPGRLFDDVYAAALSGPLRPVAGLARVPVLGAVVPWLLDRGWPGTRSSAVVRTRLIDDWVLDAVRDGMRQLVLLGAGFDSRPYRLAGLSDVRTFEVDHPATQACKLARLSRLLREAPAEVRFVPVDFETDDLEVALDRAGFRRDARSMFVWEGVVSYLPAPVVDQTFTTLAALAAAGSRVAFTFWHRGALDGTVHFDEAARWRARVARSGEPFRFGLDPAEVGQFLSDRGFALLSEASTAEVAAKYCPPLGRSEVGSRAYRVALATRTPAYS